VAEFKLVGASLQVYAFGCNSIERVGGCKIPGESLPASKLRVPYQLYPAESAAQHEEGTIKMLFIFDRDWCVREAPVVESSGYWRLDEVSLKIAMAMKFKPPVIKQYVDGDLPSCFRFHGVQANMYGSLLGWGRRSRYFHIAARSVE
jgi:TonB family protein